MIVRKILPFGFLVVCGIIAAVTPLRSADDAKPAADGTPQDEKPIPTLTKVYDVRSLVAAVDDFPFDTSPHAAAFVIPPNRQFSDGRYDGGWGGGGGGGGGGLFSGDNHEKANPTPAELREQLIKMITDTIAPETWRDSGGTLGSIREMRGMLVVTQTAANHKEIASFIRQMTDLRNQPIRTTAEWIVLPSGEIDRLLKPAGAHSKNGALREVDPAALAKLSASVRRYHADIPGRNGQTVHYLSGREKTVTVSQTASVGTDVSAYTPNIANVGEGIAIQVTPVVDIEQRKVDLTLFSTFNDHQEQGPLMALHAVATTQASSGETVEASHASATYHELSSLVQEFRTTLRIPLDVPVIAGAMTLEPSEKNGDAQQLVLIVRVQLVE